MPISTLILDKHQLVYETFGNPAHPPLVFIHGYTSGRHVWRTIIPTLSQKFYCIAIDLLGHGDSDKPHEGDYSITAQGKRVLAMADHLHVQQFGIIGHSMGGQIGMAIASELAPQRITQFINIAGVASAKLSDYVEKTIGKLYWLGYRYPVMMWFPRIITRYPLTAGIYFSSWFVRMDAIPFADWAIDREKCYTKGMENAIYHSWHAIYGYNAAPHLAKIIAPTLTIFGRQDKVVPLSDGQVAKDGIKDSQLIVMENCGHFPMYEKKEATLQAIQKFLEG